MFGLLAALYESFVHGFKVSSTKRPSLESVDASSGSEMGTTDPGSAALMAATILKPVKTEEEKLDVYDDKSADFNSVEDKPKWLDSLRSIDLALLMESTVEHMVELGVEDEAVEKLPSEELCPPKDTHELEEAVNCSNTEHPAPATAAEQDFDEALQIVQKSKEDTQSEKLIKGEAKNFDVFKEDSEIKIQPALSSNGKKEHVEVGFKKFEFLVSNGFASQKTKSEESLRPVNGVKVVTLPAALREASDKEDFSRTESTALGVDAPSGLLFDALAAMSRQKDILEQPKDTVARTETAHHADLAVEDETPETETDATTKQFQTEFEPVESPVNGIENGTSTRNGSFPNAVLKMTMTTPDSDHGKAVSSSASLQMKKASVTENTEPDHSLDESESVSRESLDKASADSKDLSNGCSAPRVKESEDVRSTTPKGLDLSNGSASNVTNSEDVCFITPKGLLPAVTEQGSLKIRARQIKNSLLRSIASTKPLSAEQIIKAVRELSESKTLQFYTSSQVVLFLWGTWDLVYTTDRLINRVTNALSAAAVINKVQMQLHVDGERRLAHSNVVITSDIFRDNNGHVSQVAIRTSSEKDIHVDQRALDGGDMHLPQIMTGIDLTNVDVPQRVTFLSMDINVSKWSGVAAAIIKGASTKAGSLMDVVEGLIPTPLVDALQSRAQQRLAVNYLDNDLCVAQAADAIYIFRKQEKDA